MRHTTTLLALTFLTAVARSQSIVQTFTSADGPHNPMVPFADTNNDGWNEWLVGDPYYDSPAGADAGRVIIVNGKCLASSGAAATEILFTAFVGAPGENAGWSIAALGDFDGDFKMEYVVGLPRMSINGGVGGRIVLLHGSFPFGQFGQSIVSWSAECDFGKSLVATGDVNGDGKPDVLVGAPSDDNAGPDAGTAYLINGAAFVLGGQIVTLHHFAGGQDGARFGEALEARDFNGDAKVDFVISAPHYALLNPNQGLVRVFSGNGYGNMWSKLGSADGEQLGTSLDAGADINGDNKNDLAIGAPYSEAGGLDAGRVRVVSGANIHSGGPETTLFDLTTWYPNAHMGKSVRIVRDLNGDGVSDVIAGSPDADGLLDQDLGGVWAFSGATGAQMGWMLGTQAQQRMGACLAGNRDFDGDSHFDILVDGRWPSFFGALYGIASVRLFPATADTYCTGKTNSNGCVPYIQCTGTASVSSNATFLVRGGNFLNNKSGHLFYGFAPSAAPFQGGTKCVASPTHRTPNQFSAGTAAPAVDCSGKYSFDFNAFLDSQVDPALVIGTEVFCQYYARDPAAVAGSSFSNAANFVIAP